MPMSGYVYICPDGHEVRKTDCKQARRKLEDCGFVFYFNHRGTLETALYETGQKNSLIKRVCF